VNPIKNLAHKIGIDKSIAYSSGSTVLAAFAGLGTIYFISSYLSGNEQGYYFTFGSLVAIQTFFDLGLTGIMTQYVAHEQAHLQWSENETLLTGEEKYRSRLSYLLHFCVKWYAIISVLLLITLIIVGFVFFSHYGKGNSITWKTPWVLVCIGTSINLFLAPIMSFLSGLGKVKEVSKILFIKQLIIPIISWTGFVIGFKLYVVGIASICTALYVITYIASTQFRPIIKNIWKIKITARVNYMKEIFPYQWKIALSWISGYFIFQLFNPVLFATEGATVAGQMGMTLQVLNAINGFSMNWINTKVPLFSRQIEMKDYHSLDKIFNKTVLQESSVCLLLLVLFYSGIYVLRTLHISFSGHILGDRFLDYIPMLLMIIPIYVNQFTFSFATYLRCHKQEPFLYQSITMGTLTMLSTLLLGHTYGLYGMCIGYCFLTVLVGTPWGYWIYKTKKEKWHT
jgi:O-antigen/teichoic acid export membrane protein